MKRIFTILSVALLALILITACTTPAPATLSPTRTPVPPTPTPVPAPTPRMVRISYIVTHSDYGRPSAGSLGGSYSMVCPMPKGKAFLTTEKPEITQESGSVKVETKGEVYSIKNWELEYLPDKSGWKPDTIKEKSGTVYIQPADCTVTVEPIEYSVEVK